VTTLVRGKHCGFESRSGTFDVDAMRAQSARATALLGAMCNEKRFMILCQLIGGERSVNELTRMLAAPQSTVSQHLALLRREGFVKARRHAQTQFYSLAGNEGRAVLETLHSLYCDPQREDT
jgi:DNA-binding transcriptional ArsR family regulator